MRWLGFVLFIIVLFSIILIGCSGFQSKNLVKGEKMSLPNMKEILQVKKEYEKGKYFRLGVIDKEQKKEVIFNAEEGRFYNDFEVQLPDNRYQIITSQDGNLRLVDRNNQIVLDRNLIKEDSLNTIKDMSYEWSNTGKYLLINQVKSQKKLLIDVSTKKRIDIPLEGWYSINWSNDDKIALVFSDTSKSVSDLNINRFIWNVEANTVQNIGYSREDGYKWSPDSSYLFSIGMTKEEDKSNSSFSYKVSRYSIKENKWSKVYETDKSIRVESLKLLTNDQFIYAGSTVNETQDPTTALMKPTQDFIVKVDCSQNNEIVRKLDSFLPKAFIWSFDNKYIYYQDNHGFFKAEVNF